MARYAIQRHEQETIEACKIRRRSGVLRDPTCFGVRRSPEWRYELTKTGKVTMRVMLLRLVSRQHLSIDNRPRSWICQKQIAHDFRSELYYLDSRS